MILLFSDTNEMIVTIKSEACSRKIAAWKKGVAVKFSIQALLMHGLS